MIHVSSGYRSGVSKKVAMTLYKPTVRSKKVVDPNVTIMVRNYRTYSIASPVMLIFDKLGNADLEDCTHMVHQQIVLDWSPSNVFFLEMILPL